MEGRVILKNADLIAVRLVDGTYSVFKLKSHCLVEIGDVFLGPLCTLGAQTLLHSGSDSLVEAQVKLAATKVASKTKHFVGHSAMR